MKKSLYFAIAAALCLSGGLAYENFGPLSGGKDSQVATKVPGKDLVSQVRASYQAGDFDAFFKEMDQIYGKIKSNDQIKDYNQMRSGTNLQQQSEFGILPKQDSASPMPIDQFIFNIHHKQLGTGQSAEENSLIALDLEYEIKGMNLDLLSPTSSYQSLDPKVLMYALKMEQTDKMQTVAQTFSDQSLKETCMHFAKNLDHLLSTNYDTSGQHPGGNNQAEPVTQNH